jgi:citrate/tricarballylate utilization protein
MNAPNPLQSLIDQARADALTPGLVQAQDEVARVMQICNACRYCEGFCAVFPAMTQRLEFARADVHYLANLCHQCGACLHSCQYAPPNAFGVNVPGAMAALRARTYQAYAWPAPLAQLYQHNGLVVALALCAAISGFLLASLAYHGSLWQRVEGGNFYAIFPHKVLVGLFGPVFIAAILALAMGVRNYWTAVRPRNEAGTPQPSVLADRLRALDAAARLRYLDGGHSQGCTPSDDQPSPWRKMWHQASMYGFALCLASTAIATLYHYVLGWHAPYPLLSLPVLLGTLGGLGLVAGPVGLLVLRRRQHRLLTDPAQQSMDLGFIALLLACGITGLALLALRETAALPLTLALHMGSVLAFFVTMPYGKFAHGFYRGAALLQFAIEQRLPRRLRIGGE